MSAINIPEPTLQSWLSRALSVADAEFVPAASVGDSLFMPLFESKAALGVALQAEIDPYRSVPGVAWSAHAARPGGIDMLMATYEAAGLSIRIVEGRSFVLVRAAKVGTRLVDAPDKSSYVREIVARVLKVGSDYHSWRFTVPASLELSQPILVTSEGAPRIKDMNTRYDRADLLVLQQEVYVIAYKKPDQIVGFRQDDDWFGAEARSAIERLRAR